MAFIVKREVIALTEIPVATTNTIIVTGNPIYNGTYTKISAFYYQSATQTLNFDFALGSPERWYFFDGDAYYEQSDPPAFNANFIPCAFGNGITITAA